MKEKMENLLRGRLEEISDEVHFLVASYDSEYQYKRHYANASEETKKEAILRAKNSIDNYYNEFITALEVFNDAGMLEENEYKTWKNTAWLMRREGRQAVSLYYNKGRKWYEEYLDEDCKLRHAI